MMTNTDLRVALSTARLFAWHLTAHVLERIASRAALERDLALAAAAELHASMVHTARRRRGYEDASRIFAQLEQCERERSSGACNRGDGDARCDTCPMREVKP